MNDSDIIDPTGEMPDLQPEPSGKPPEEGKAVGRAPGDWFWWLPPRFRNSPYWIIAIVLHAILLLLAGFIVVFHLWRPGDISGGIYDGGGNEGVDVSPPPATTQPTQQLQNAPTPSTSTAFNQLAQAIATTGVGDWSVAAPTEVASSTAMVASNVSGTGKGIPGAYTGRIGGGTRRGLLSKKGGTSNVEESVNKALEWLKKHQTSDGSWGEDFKAGMTGLAVLCFLAHGDVQGSEKYGGVVEKGTNWLIQYSKSHGGMMNTSGRVEYEHAIAALALSENYAMAPTVPDLEDTAKKAIDVIVKAQTSSGCWAYGYSKEEGGQNFHADTSVAGWNIQAVKAAQLGKLDVPGIDNSLQQAAKMLKGMYNAGQGSFGYTNAGEAHWTLRGVGIYNLQLILDKAGDDGVKPWKKTDEVMKALDALIKDDTARCDWDKAQGVVLYGWYYNTYASFFGEGQYWTQWNGQFRDPIIRHQEKDGHWAIPAGSVEQTWITKNADSDVYSTALCCLMLQVYWRHLTT